MTVMLMSQMSFLMRPCQICSGWNLEGFSVLKLARNFFLNEHISSVMIKEQQNVYLIKRASFILFLGLVGLVLFVTVALNFKKSLDK